MRWNEKSYSALCTPWSALNTLLLLTYFQIKLRLYLITYEEMHPLFFCLELSRGLAVSPFDITSVLSQFFFFFLIISGSLNVLLMLMLLIVMTQASIFLDCGVITIFINGKPTSLITKNIVVFPAFSVFAVKLIFVLLLDQHRVSFFPQVN